MRKTKIVCTIGPACREEKVFKEICKAGLNVARLNFSHSTHEEHQEVIDMVKNVREELNLPIAIMLDTKGPEYRIKTFANGKIMLHDGDTFTFTTKDVEGDETKVSVTYSGLAKDLSVGDRVLVNNGLVIFEVTGLTETDAICKVVVGGELSDRKRFDFVNKIVRQVESKAARTSKKTIGDKVDAILTNKWIGIPFFALVMYLVFQISQVWVGTPIADRMVALLEVFQEFVKLEAFQAYEELEGLLH